MRNGTPEQSLFKSNLQNTDFKKRLIFFTMQSNLLYNLNTKTVNLKKKWFYYPCVAKYEIENSSRPDYVSPLECFIKGKDANQ